MVPPNGPVVTVMVPSNGPVVTVMVPPNGPVACTLGLHNNPTLALTLIRPPTHCYVWGYSARRPQSSLYMHCTQLPAPALYTNHKCMCCIICIPDTVLYICIMHQALYIRRPMHIHVSIPVPSMQICICVASMYRMNCSSTCFSSVKLPSALAVKL